MRASATATAIDHRHHPRLHRLGHVPVPRADHGALTLATAAGLVAHQLIDHPSRNATILQPRREGVAQVMRAVQVEIGQLGPGHPSR